LGSIQRRDSNHPRKDHRQRGRNPLDALDSGRDDDPLCQRSRCPDQGDARTPDDEQDPPEYVALPPTTLLAVIAEPLHRAEVAAVQPPPPRSAPHLPHGCYRPQCDAVSVQRRAFSASRIAISANISGPLPSSASSSISAATCHSGYLYFALGNARMYSPASRSHQA